MIIPEVVFREGQNVLLDDSSLEDIKVKSRADIRISDVSVRGLIKAIMED